MRKCDHQVLLLDADELHACLNELCQIVIESVRGGAAISFMLPVSQAEVRLFWQQEIAPEVEAGQRLLLAARHQGQIVGTVQLVLAMPPNQAHRCEISKMMVHPAARRLGIGRSLMQAALDEARKVGKKLVTLDTRTGDAAEPLYLSVGFQKAGIIPDFADDPDGQARHATTYMYKRI